MSRLGSFVRTGQRLKWQLISLVSTSLAMALAFQNCAPSLESCVGGSCSEGRSSARSGNDLSSHQDGRTPNSDRGGIVTPEFEPEPEYEYETPLAPNPSQSEDRSSESTSPSQPPSSSPPSASVSSPLVFHVHPQNMTVQEGQSLDLAAFALSGRPQYITYQWYKNGQAILGATRNTYHLSNAKRSDLDNATFFVKASDGQTQATSNLAKIKVIPPRDPCLKGWYGKPLSGSRLKANEIPSTIELHGTKQVTNYSLYELPETYDSYTFERSCKSTSHFGGRTEVCTGSRIWQCRNARYVLVSDSCDCTTHRD